MGEDTGLNFIKQFISSYWFKLEIDVEDAGDVSWKEKSKFSGIRGQNIPFTVNSSGFC